MGESHARRFRPKDVQRQANEVAPPASSSAKSIAAGSRTPGRRKASSQRDVVAHRQG